MFQQVANLFKEPLYVQLHKYLCNISEGLNTLSSINYPNVGVLQAEFTQFQCGLNNLDTLNIDMPDVAKIDQLIERQKQELSMASGLEHNIVQENIAALTSKRDNMVFSSRISYLHQYAVKLSYCYNEMVLQPLSTGSISNHLNSNTVAYIYHLHLQIASVKSVCTLLKHALDSSNKSHFMLFKSSNTKGSYWESFKQSTVNWTVYLAQGAIDSKINTTVAECLSIESNNIIQSQLIAHIGQQQNPLEQSVSGSSSMSKKATKALLEKSIDVTNRFQLLKFSTGFMKDLVDEDALLNDSKAISQLSANIITQFFHFVDMMLPKLQSHLKKLPALDLLLIHHARWGKKTQLDSDEIALTIANVTQCCSQLQKELSSLREPDLAALNVFVGWVSQILVQFSLATIADDITKELTSLNVSEAMKGMYFTNLFYEIFKIIEGWQHKFIQEKHHTAAETGSLVIEEQPVFADFAPEDNPAVVTDGKQAKASGSGFYQHKTNGQKYFFKRVINTMYLADDIAEVLFTSLVFALKKKDLFSTAGLVKSEKNTVFVTSEYQDGYTPIFKPVTKVTSRIPPASREELFHQLSTEQKSQLANILSVCLLLNDRDCNITNIGFTKGNKLVKIDAGWAFEDLVLGEILLKQELLAPRAFRPTPSNAIKDYPNVVYSQFFIDAIGSLEESFNKDVIKSNVSDSLSNMMAMWHGSTVPSSAQFVCDRINYHPKLQVQTSEVYSGRDVLYAIAGRIGYKFSLDISTGDLFKQIVDVIVESLQQRLNSLLLTKHIISLKLLISNETLPLKDLKVEINRVLDGMLQASEKTALSVNVLLDKHLPDIGFSVLSDLLDVCSEKKIRLPRKYRPILQWFGNQKTAREQPTVREVVMRRAVNAFVDSMQQRATEQVISTTTRTATTLLTAPVAMAYTSTKRKVNDLTANSSTHSSVKPNTGKIL